VTFPSRALRSRSTHPRALQGLLVAVLIGLLVSLVAAPASAATEKELIKARNERAAVQAELDRTAAAYDAAQAKLAETQASIAAGQESLKVAEVKEQQAQVRLSARADIMYRRGPVAIFQFLVGAESLNDFGVRMKLIEGAAKQDTSTIAEAAKTRSETTALQQQLLADEQEQKALLASMSDQTKSLTSNFTKAQELEAKLAADRAAALKAEQEKAAKAAAAAKAKTEAAKKTAAAAALAVPTPTTVVKALASPSPSAGPVKLAAGPAVPVGTKGFCPVNGPVSFTDTWGAPRSGGRRHQGVDMFAAMRTPAAAIVDGVLLRRETSSLGGMSVYLKGNNGNEYFYTHLSGYSDVAPGQKVSAGQTIGYVGDSGNASGGPPHLHFEIRQGGVPINPTPTARLACGK
jgi:murein DD-endopeptidase MepM/ murein hydrolase activator NlpD